MKLKQLESALSGVEVFEKPKWQLEQYPTSAHLAARILYTADSSFEDIEDKTVCDLGCGTAMLGIASQIMGAGYTLGIDLDEDALSQAKDNIDEFEVEMDLLQADISADNFLAVMDNRQPFDTVIMNPPFGTRTKGIDMVFLQRAIQMCSGAVYSLHKSSTREHIVKKAKEWGVGIEVLAELRFDIPEMYKFHKKKSVDVEVDLLRLDVTKKNIVATSSAVN